MSIISIIFIKSILRLLFLKLLPLQHIISEQPHCSAADSCPAGTSPPTPAAAAPDTSSTTHRGSPTPVSPAPWPGQWCAPLRPAAFLAATAATGRPASLPASGRTATRAADAKTRRSADPVVGRRARRRCRAGASRHRQVAGTRGGNSAGLSPCLRPARGFRRRRVRGWRRWGTERVRRSRPTLRTTKEKKKEEEKKRR